VLWGRLALEEESPEGPFTPLAGVDVLVYPATSRLVAELERIRLSARGSLAEHESAVARVQQALAAHQAEVDAEQLGGGTPRPSPGSAAGARASGPAPPASPGRDGAGEDKGARSTLRREVTDLAGLFVFDGLPSGEWLLVAVRTTPYGGQRLRADAKPRPPSQRFLSRQGGPAKEMEIWMARVRVEPEGRARVFLTDRARWLVGPIR
jgi:hypothetical protein